MTTQPQRAPAIFAPDVVVDAWRKEYGRAVHAANRPLDPALRESLNRTPREARELIVLMSEALRHAGGIFLASVSNAIPDAAALFAEGLEALAKEVAAEQERADLDADLAALVADDRARRPLGDDGCEGGVQ